MNAWVTTGCWAEKKIAQSLTRKQVVNNILRSINNVAENLGNNKDITDIGGTSDRLAKLAATIKTLDKEVSAVDYMECFMNFGKWLEGRSEIDPEVTPQLCMTVNDLQNKFVIETLGVGKGK